MEYLGISGKFLAKAESQLQNINLVKLYNINRISFAEVNEFNDASGEDNFRDFLMC